MPEPRRNILLHLPGEAATLALGAAIARLIAPGDVIALHGELGAGKTTLARGLIRALAGPDADVPSPTYTLVQGHDLPGLTLFHIDLYRINQPDDVFELGWDDMAGGVMLVEWPLNAGANLPGMRLDITLLATDAGDGGGRRADLGARGEAWQERLAALDLPADLTELPGDGARPT